jgi:hypothetical protein
MRHGFALAAFAALLPTIGLAQAPPEPVAGIWYTSLDAAPFKLGLVRDAASLEPIFFYATCGAQDGAPVARVSIEVGNRVLAESISTNERLAVRLEAGGSAIEAPVETMSLNEAAARPDGAWTAALALRNAELFTALASPGGVLLHIVRLSTSTTIVRSFRLPDDNRAAAATAFAQACFVLVPKAETQAAPPPRTVKRKSTIRSKATVRSKTTVRTKSARPARTVTRAKPKARPAVVRATKGAKKPRIRAPLRITPR